jgi:glycoside/pentoside/hexuronide:cation symporter, GPH family
VTSTLFLFYVESRLEAPGWEGAFLLLFFLSAAIAAPVWARLAGRFGVKPVLLAGMALAVAAFAFAAGLGAGDGPAFAVVCIASGAALGADMTLIAAIFARRLSRLMPEAAAGFGIYAFVTKLSLAIAAATLLPVLEWQGFVSGGENEPRALATLTMLYAVLPCGLKLLAIYLLTRTPVDED